MNLEQLDEIEKSLQINDLVYDFLFAVGALINDFHYEINEDITKENLEFNSYHTGTLDAKTKGIGSKSKSKKINLIGGEKFTLSKIEMNHKFIRELFEPLKHDYNSFQDTRPNVADIKQRIFYSFICSVVFNLSGVKLEAEVPIEFIKSSEVNNISDDEFYEFLKKTISEERKDTIYSVGYEDTAEIKSSDGSEIKTIFKNPKKIDFTQTLDKSVDALAKEIFNEQRDLIKKISDLTDVSYDDAWS